MADVLVKPHIFEFMKSSNLLGAQQILEYNKSNSESVYTTVRSNSANWQSVYTTVRANSANWDVNELISFVVDRTNSLSSFVVDKTTRVTLNTTLTSFNFTNDQSGVITTYTKTPNITAYVNSDVNTPNYVTTVAQLSTGSVTIRLHPSYTTGVLISYGELYETAGKGATANIVRVTDNTFLLTGLLQ